MDHAALPAHRDSATEKTAPYRTETSLVLVTITPNAVSRMHLLPSGSVTVGRSDAADVRIDDPLVSRLHARIHIGDRIEVEDLGSSNGTFVGWTSSSAEPHRRVEIAIGQPVRVGGATLCIWEMTREEGCGGAPPAPVSCASIVVVDPAMKQAHALVERVAQGSISVLLMGETGTGKEVFAEEVHRRSPRAGKPFVKLNCASLTESLLEAELFGHERGAFTGAAQAKPGLLEAADGGTAFLDEIGELPISLQAKLLRVLEDGALLRLGAVKPRRIDVRFVAATNRDLEAEAGQGTFRRDLFFRLAGVAITIPPLRVRRSEIGDLARMFTERACARSRIPVPRLAPETLSLLERYAWPGNLRELRNAMERAALLCEGSVIAPSDLPLAIAGVDAPTAASSPGGSTMLPPRLCEDTPLRHQMEAIERQRIVEVLARCAGNQTRAAEVLGMPRRTLTKRLGQYDVPRPRAAR